MTETCKRLLIKNGIIINHDRTIKGDILIDNGKIVRIEENLEDSEAKVIDAVDSYILPGGVDLETYFNAERGGIKSPEDYFSGTQAALFGGTTTVVNCLEVTTDESVKQKFEEERKLAEKDIVCNVAFEMCLPALNDTTKAEFRELLESKAVLPLVRLSLINKGNHYVALNDTELYEAMSWCRDNFVIPTVHAENDKLIASLEKELLALNITGPEGHYLSRIDQIEDEAVFRVLSIAELVKCPVHFNRIYTEAVVEKIQNFRKTSVIPIFCGTSLVAVVHTAQKVMDSDWKTAASFITIPALKMNTVTRNGCSGLLSKVAENKIDHVVSSHLVFNIKHKASGKNDFRCIIPGTNGVGYRLPVLLEKGVKDGFMEMTRFVDCVSTTPAKIANLYPQKGSISVGSDGDIVIWSSCDSFDTRESGDIDVFKDIKPSYKPQYVIVNGNVVLDKSGNLLTQRGSGTLIKVTNDASLNPMFQKVRILKEVQNNVESKVCREPYTGDVIDVTNSGKSEKFILYSDLVTTDVYKRTPAEEVKEALPPGQRVIRTSVKTAQPPGGSQSSWWG